MPSNIIVEFSGWCRLSPENARFQYIGEDVVAAIRDSDDNEWTHIDPFVELSLAAED